MTSAGTHNDNFTLKIESSHALLTLCNYKNNVSSNEVTCFNKTFKHIVEYAVLTRSSIVPDKEVDRLSKSHNSNGLNIYCILEKLSIGYLYIGK